MSVGMKSQNEAPIKSENIKREILDKLVEMSANEDRFD